VSCSRYAIDAAKLGDITALRKVAAASAMARAADFAGLVPTISEKWLEYAQKCHEGDFVVDRESSIRATGEEGVKKSHIEQTVRKLNMRMTSRDEDPLLDALGFSCNLDEKGKFKLHPWNLESLNDFKGFASSLPPSWRPV
jgi:hypothetical protein